VPWQRGDGKRSFESSGQRKLVKVGNLGEIKHAEKEERQIWRDLLVGDEND